MAILLDSENNVFTLQTNHSMYQMKADRYGVLLHTWFGEKGKNFDYSYLITYADLRNIPHTEAATTAEAP